MHVSKEIRSKYQTYDPEFAVLLDHWDEPEGCKVLEVGSHDSPFAEIIAPHYRVVGVDLRPYDHDDSRHTHVVGDFCNLPNDFWREHRGTFDAAVSISAIEHFGLGAYEEGRRPEMQDVVACRYIYDLLKPGGRCYVTIPFGGRFVEIRPHWRVYDWASILDRIIQEFQLLQMSLAFVDAFEVGGEKYNVGSPVNPFVALLNTVGSPAIAVLLKMQKPI